MTEPIKRGRGQPRISIEPVTTITITITAEHLTELKAINPIISKALRQVMNERNDHGKSAHPGA